MFSMDAKYQQEEMVFSVFNQNYPFAIEYQPNSHNTNAFPDFQVRINNISVGVELFELYQFHELISWCNDIESKIKENLFQLEDESHFSGTIITVLFTRDENFKEIYIRGKKGQNIFKSVCKDLDELTKNELSFFSQSENIRQISVVQSEYPSLATISDIVIFTKSIFPQYTIKQNMPPLKVIFGPTSDLTLVESESIKTINKKINIRKKNISKFPISILIAHDLQRNCSNIPLTRDWAPILKRVVEKTEIKCVYDEFWLVSFIEPNGCAKRIF